MVLKVRRVELRQARGNHRGRPRAWAGGKHLPTDRIRPLEGETDLQPRTYWRALPALWRLRDNNSGVMVVPSVLHENLVSKGEGFLRSIGCTTFRYASISLYDGRKIHPDLHGAGAGICAIVEAKTTRGDLVRSKLKFESMIRLSRGWSPVAQYLYVSVPDLRVARGAMPYGWGLLLEGELVIEAPRFMCRMKRFRNWRCSGYECGGHGSVQHARSTEYQTALASVGRRIP